MFEQLIAFLESKLGAVYADATKACVTSEELAQSVHVEYEKNMSMAKIGTVVLQAQTKFPMYFFKCKGRAVDILPRHGYVLS